MKTLPFITAALIAATPAFAEGTRQLNAHEHGVGQLDIAFDGKQIALEFHAPGADIVGFEYAAESAKDRTAIDAAVATLARPLDLFVMPAAAECSVTQASAELESEELHDAHDDEHHEHEEHAEGHDEHDHEEHAEDHDEHDHEEHAEDHDEHDHEEHAEGHDEHDHEEHAEGHDEHDHEEHAEGHDEHDHEEHAEGHDEHDHEEHAASSGHTEFHAEYLLTCAHPEAVNQITFAYFDTFPNALEVEVQIISDKGATAFEVERDEPVLELGGVI